MYNINVSITLLTGSWNFFSFEAMSYMGIWLQFHQL